MGLTLEDFECHIAELGKRTIGKAPFEMEAIRNGAAGKTGFFGAMWQTPPSGIFLERLAS
jgi:hypothetical protein